MKKETDNIEKATTKALSKANVKRIFPHTKVNLRDEDIKGMIDTYEFLVWNNKGEDKKHCQRVLRQLKKAINCA